MNALRDVGLGPLRFAACLAGVIAVIVADRYRPPAPLLGYTSADYYADN